MLGVRTAPVAKHGPFVFLVFGRFERVLLSGCIMYPTGNDRVLYGVLGKIKFLSVVVRWLFMVVQFGPLVLPVWRCR